MDADHAALIFKSWAASEGLIQDAQGALLAPGAPDFVQINPVTDVGKQILRSKHVSAVAFNASEKEILVFTRRTAPTTKRMLKALPASVDDVAIKYRQGHQEIIGGPPAVPFGSPPYVVRQSAAGRFYACGSSVSVGNCRDAGTFGCLVRNATGQLFGLSNNHVTGSCSFAPVGLPILAPGVHDVAAGGLHPFTLGTHQVSLPIVTGAPDNVNASENLDAAIFTILNPDAVTSFQGMAYDTPTAAAPISPGMAVEKVGRTTGHTRGTVVAQMHGPFPIGYAAQLYGFAGQIYFEPLYVVAGAPSLFSDNGDSGSLVVNVAPDGSRTAVGLIVGGMADGSAAGGKVTLVLPLETILAKFAVSLVSNHNI